MRENGRTCGAPCVFCIFVAVSFAGRGLVGIVGVRLAVAVLELTDPLAHRVGE